MTHNQNIAGWKPVTSRVTWMTANEHCSSQNDYLIDILDVQNNLSNLKGLPPIWSSVRGQFTPWTAYRGCLKEYVCKTVGSHSTLHFCHYIENNTAGNCYFECKSKYYTNGGCADTASFFFALSKSICICLCDNTPIQHISDISKCNLSCGSSIDNGECGGIGYFSVYESMNIYLPVSHFGGFCLTCGPHSDSKNTMLYGIDCNKKATGYCIISNGSVLLPPMMSTFASYWTQCRNYNAYIVGDASQTFCQSDTIIWTGLRKYKIDNSNIDNDSCYVIETHQETINYKRKNCTENHFFLCKQEIDQMNIPSTEFINSTKNTAQPPLHVTREISWTSETTFSYKIASTRRNTTSYINATTKARSLKSVGNKATIAGASIAGIIALTFGVFLVVFLFKRRRFQWLQENQQHASRVHVSNNTTYDDLDVTSQRQDDNHTYTTLSYDKQAKY